MALYRSSELTSARRGEATAAAERTRESSSTISNAGGGEHSEVRMMFPAAVRLSAQPAKATPDFHYVNPEELAGVVEDDAYHEKYVALADLTANSQEVIFSQPCFDEETEGEF